MSDDEKLVERFAKAQESLVLQAADFSLKTISDMVEGGSIDVAPEYQRRLRWTTEQQSTLIESFLINVPIPPIYLSEDEYGTYSVIDGRQRITAINLFLRDELPLKGLSKLPELNGRVYSQLPPQLARTLMVRPFIRSITLLKQSDPDLKYEVFTRLNRGGQTLNNQEVRNAAYRGALNDLIYSLAEEPFLKKQLKIHDKNAPNYRQMVDAEYVLRFLTLRDTWKSFSGDLSSSLDKWMHQNQRANSSQIEKFRVAFETSIQACRAIWGDFAFRRPVEGDGWRDQTLAGMFDAQMVAVDMLTPSQRQSAASASEEVLSKTRDLFADRDFEQAVRVATNTPSSVKRRVETVYELLRGQV